MSEDQTSQQHTTSNSHQESDNSQKNTGMAIVGTIPILFFVPLLTEAKDDEFVTFHSKQGLVLLIYVASVFIFGLILALIPILG